MCAKEVVSRELACGILPARALGECTYWQSVLVEIKYILFRHPLQTCTSQAFPHASSPMPVLSNVEGPQALFIPIQQPSFSFNLPDSADFLGYLNDTTILTVFIPYGKIPDQDA